MDSTCLFPDLRILKIRSIEFLRTLEELLGQGTGNYPIYYQPLNLFPLLDAICQYLVPIFVGCARAIGRTTPENGPAFPQLFHSQLNHKLRQTKSAKDKKLLTASNFDLTTHFFSVVRPQLFSFARYPKSDEVLDWFCLSAIRLVPHYLRHLRSTPTGMTRNASS